jgi:tripartite-type tricarboxylate transporter receptor subunit TctC
MRRILVAVLAFLPLGVCVAQDRYPSQPVQVISVFGAGGGTDIIARAYATEMARLLGQPFVVVNRDGAAGSIGFAALAAARADGYTISFAPNTPLVNSPHVIKSLSYGFDSIVPVCSVFNNVFSMAVAPSSPYKTLKDLLDDARAKPDKIAYGNAGLGSLPHISMAAITRAAGVAMNPIAFRGDTGVLPQLMSGELPVGVVAVSSILGRDLRVLAVFSDRRQPAYPDSPSVTELGFPKMPQALNGVFVPRGVAKPVLETLERTCEQVAHSPSFVAVVEKLNQAVEYQGSAEFSKVLKADYEFRGRLLKDIRFGEQ